MPATGIAEAGFAIGAVNAVVGLPNHAKTWNTTYHDVVDFRKKVAEARFDLNVCITEFLEWMEIWKYKSAEWNSFASLFLAYPDDTAPTDKQTPAGGWNTPMSDQRLEGDHRTPQDTGLIASYNHPNHQSPIKYPPGINRKSDGELLSVHKKITTDHAPMQHSIDGIFPVSNGFRPGEPGKPVKTCIPPRSAQSVLPAPDQGPSANLIVHEPVAINVGNVIGAESRDDGLYRTLWGNQYFQIREAVDKVVQEMKGINEHIDRIVNEKKNSPAWRRRLNVHRARYLRNLTYALFSNTSLRDTIARLKVYIAHLKEVSERRLRNLQGNATELKLTGSEAFHLANLEYFGRKIVQELPATLPTASAWSLELCHPDIGGSAGNWQHLTSVQLWLAYSMPQVEQHGVVAQDRQRIILKYSLDKDPDPPYWVSSLPGADPDRNGSHNPRLIKNRHGTGHSTMPFRNLFRIWHGDESFQAELWAWDQAYLVLSLANWSLLLWTSDWTARWCSSGICFVRVATDVRKAGKHAFFFPSFSRCALEGLRTTVNQGQHQQDDCCHSDLKLCNLGLVLAETICITPLRISTVQPDEYEKCVEGQWQSVSETALLDLVDEMTSRSKSVRDAIQWCLHSTDTVQGTRDKIAGFYKKYVQMVFDPIKKWCDKQQENYVEYIEPLLPYIEAGMGTLEEEYGQKLYLWPNDAFHTSGSEGEEIGEVAEED